MSQAVTILGEKELKRVFRVLPEKVGYKVSIQALRMSGRKLVSIIRKEAPRRTGTLKKSIGIIRSKNKQKPAVLVAVRTKKKYWPDGFYAWFVHAGTKGFGKRLVRDHRNKKRSALKYSRSGAGLKANPFFQRGVDKGLPVVLNSLQESYSKVVVRYLKRNVPNYN